MATSALAPALSNELTERAEGGLDVDWLLQSKKDISSQSARRAKPTPPPLGAPENRTIQEPEHSFPGTSTPSKKLVIDEDHVAPDAGPRVTPKQASPPVQQANVRTPQSSTSVASRTPTPHKPAEQNRVPLGTSGPKDKRRSSWFSSLGSKLSGSSKDDKTKSPRPSPALEKGNPFESKSPAKEEPQVVVTHTRRPSVLVAAGTETKLDPQPGFLSSALRRLSSGNTATLGKAAGNTNNVLPRRIMNVDHNRERTKISEFDQNKLRRVAFKVDVEIAGIAAAAEEDDNFTTPGSQSAPPADESKESKMAKYKDKSEGAAFKKSQSLPEDDQNPKVSSESQARAEEERTKQLVEQHIASHEAQDKSASDIPTVTVDGETPPTTRKKEKKKRSEAERKERKERKRRHAEANGLVPLELKMEDSSDSSSTPTPPGASTPKKGQPTTDPLRIYKRCCQLRETTALSFIKEQISKPSATLAEAPGTVASIDLSGNQMSLQDITTLGDWLAVVPVRRLILDNCNLSDEGLRILLAGLMGCKSQEQMRHNKKLPKWYTKQRDLEQMGVIERLSLKNNPGLSSIGWKYIALFLHMCRSLRGLDLTGIPFPNGPSANLSRTSTTSTSMSGSSDLPLKGANLAALFSGAISTRYGERLEELILSNCSLSPATVSAIVDSAVKRKIKRLGLANNNFDMDAVGHVVRYITSGVCEGLDMGGNNLRDCGHLLTEVLDDNNPLMAMSLAGCNIGVEDLQAVLQHLSRLKHFKFIDLSNNHDLFTEGKDCLSILRRGLPKLKDLRRIHLQDVDMNGSQLISLSEILPDVPVLAHLSVLDNPKLVQCMNSPQAEDQEDACAMFVSLMTAVRASKTLVAVEIEVPSAESNEVVKALASQVVAYSLRNLERATLGDLGIQSDAMPERLDKQPPEVLMHLVGHMEGYSENHDNDEPAPDEDYMIASTGIVRALNTCLKNRELTPQNLTPSASGTATPVRGAALASRRTPSSRKPKDVSLELCESARKIRKRLQPAMIKEDRAGNSLNYRRLLALDQTLARTIQRFEDEYPETIKPQAPLTFHQDSYLSDSEQPPSYGQTDTLDRIDSGNGSIEETSITNAVHGGNHPYDDPYGLKLSRTASNTSLAARAQAQEEGRMHRFGQTFRREVLKPVGTDDVLHGTSVNDAPEPTHIAALRARLEALGGETIRQEVNSKGADAVIRELGITSEEIRIMARDHPENFEALKTSKLAASMSAGYADSPYMRQVNAPEPETIAVPLNQAPYPTLNLPSNGAQMIDVDRNVGQQHQQQ